MPDLYPLLPFNSDIIAAVTCQTVIASITGRLDPFIAFNLDPFTSYFGPYPQPFATTAFLTSIIPASFVEPMRHPYLIAWLLIAFPLRPSFLMV